eukprot:g20348.t1
MRKTVAMLKRGATAENVAEQVAKVKKVFQSPLLPPAFQQLHAETQADRQRKRRHLGNAAWFNLLIGDPWMHHLGWEYAIDPWNIFDYSLVVFGWTDASSLRLFRLLRVVRSIRGIKVLAGLWVVIQGLLDSYRTVLWVGELSTSADRADRWEADHLGRVKYNHPWS